VQHTASVPAIRKELAEIRLDLLVCFMVVLFTLAWPKAVPIASVHQERRDITTLIPRAKLKMIRIHNLQAHIRVAQDCIYMFQEVLVKVALAKSLGQTPDPREQTQVFSDLCRSCARVVLNAEARQEEVVRRQHIPQVFQGEVVHVVAV
jgi:hypothetical protein